MVQEHMRARPVSRCHIAGIVLFCLVGGARPTPADVVIDFEDLLLDPESFYNGSNGAGGFTSRGAFFNNSFTDFGGGFVAWSGWSYSNVTDNSTPGFENQYSAIAGGGADGSSNYAVAFAPIPNDAAIELPASTFSDLLLVTNTTYAYYSMLNGDAFAKRFGGESGYDPDYFLLTITGFDDWDEPIGAVDFYLADYRYDDNRRDYIVDAWTQVDLSILDAATKLTFSLESSDIGPYGINTPTYFAIDNLDLVPEPATLVLTAFGVLAIFRIQRGRQSLR